MFTRVAVTEEPYWLESLEDLGRMVDLGPTSGDGWNQEAARLFALDTAMLVFRRNLGSIGELDRRTLVNRLTEARRLVIDGRDSELGSIQAEFETFLSSPWGSRQRTLWLTAVNSLVPCSYRAAQATVAAAIRADSAPLSSLIPALRERLAARISEGSLLQIETGLLAVG